MTILSPIDAAYLAGLIDGEGCISVTRTKSKNIKACNRGYAYRSSLSITMTDKNVLGWVQNITQVGNVIKKKKYKKNHKQAWSWTVWSKQASALLEQLLPYLKIKTLQAENLILFQDKMRYPGKNGLSDIEWIFREELYITSKELNKRG